jgi:hypothetical protein
MNATQIADFDRAAAFALASPFGPVSRARARVFRLTLRELGFTAKLKPMTLLILLQMVTAGESAAAREVYLEMANDLDTEE